MVAILIASLLHFGSTIQLQNNELKIQINELEVKMDKKFIEIDEKLANLTGVISYFYFNNY